MAPQRRRGSFFRDKGKEQGLIRAPRPLGCPGTPVPRGRDRALRYLGLILLTVLFLLADHLVLLTAFKWRRSRPPCRRRACRAE